MKKIFIPILLGAALIANSCQSKLEIPQKGVVDYDTYYASDADCEAALANMYANYITNVAGTEGIDNPEQVMLNYSSDDIYAAGGNSEDHQPFRSFCEFRYDHANTTLKSAYQRYYYAIYHANLVISNFTTENRYGEAPKHTSAYTAQAVAEARVMRAYLHMMLALQWNCPPIMDRVYNADELPENSESQNQVLSWVVEQCEEAISSGSLPERASKNDKDATARASKGFAQFVAGKAAVFNGDYTTAKKYLGDLIKSDKYDLVPTDEYWTNFHAAGDGSVEKIFEPNVIADQDYLKGFSAYYRTRWMVSNVFCWRTDALAATPSPQSGFGGWNGGAVVPAFAEKFLAHDGDSPRRRACFLTEDEWLYEMDWDGSEYNDGTLAEKKADPKRGISSANGVYSHGKFFEWKHMCFTKIPSILAGDKVADYPSDNIDYLGKPQNATNFKVARYAEALLLYAEACLNTNDISEGEKYLHKIQERSGSGKVTSLTFENLVEEKQYEMWFESCRFLDLVRWNNEGKISDAKLAELFDTPHANVTTVKDRYFKEGDAKYQKEHELYTEKADITYNKFESKYKYFPFPLDVKNANSNLHDVLGWAE